MRKKLYSYNKEQFFLWRYSTYAIFPRKYFTYAIFLHLWFYLRNFPLTRVFSSPKMCITRGPPVLLHKNSLFKWLLKVVWHSPFIKLFIQKQKIQIIDSTCILVFIYTCFLCVLNWELMWQQKVISCGFAIKNQ